MEHAVKGGCDNNGIPQAGCGQEFGEALETGSVVLSKWFRRIRIVASGAGLALLLAVMGCGSFFQCEGKADCGTSGSGSGSGSSTGDYVYVSNSTTSSSYINGYSISSTGLTATTNSPYQLNYIPTAMTISPNNSFLYICSGTNIYGYSIGTGGSLSILNSGATLVAEDCAALAISPDGQWLFSLNTNDLTIEEYQITSSTGLLSNVANYQITNSYSGAIAAAGIQVAPSGAFIAVALGTAGTEIFSFNTSTGAATYASQISAASASSGDYAVAIDTNNSLYIAATNDLYVFSVTSAGVPTQVSTTATGTGPYSVAVDGTSYVYAGSENSVSSPIVSAFAISTSNPLAAVSGSPFNGPTNISAMGVDKTSGYLAVAGYNSNSGLQLFSIGTTGALTSIATAGTGTTTLIPTVMALTH